MSATPTDFVDLLSVLDARVSVVEGVVVQLKNIEKSLNFLDANIDFFKSLSTGLEPRLTLIEIAVNTGLPAQIVHQAQLNRTDIVTEAVMRTQAAL
ncbi:hypothetical protein EDD11_009086, partial [Mortierella claussenii]